MLQTCVENPNTWSTRLAMSLLDEYVELKKKYEGRVSETIRESGTEGINR